VGPSRCACRAILQLCATMAANLDARETKHRLTILARVMRCKNPTGFRSGDSLGGLMAMLTVGLVGTALLRPRATREVVFKLKLLMTRSATLQHGNAAAGVTDRAGIATRLGRILGVCVLMELAFPLPAKALLLDSTSFGTGVYFGSSELRPPFTDSALSAVVIANRQHSSGATFFTAGSAGAAVADASPTEFSVGTDAVSQHGGGIHSAFAGAVAYTGMTIDGDTPPSLRGAINIEGTITPEEAFDGGFMRVFVTDFDSPFVLAWLLVEAVGGVATAGGPPSIQYSYNVCSSATSCSASSGLPWGGSFSLPFSLPLGTNNGIILSMFSQADAAFTGGGAIVVDFLDTASITFDPPPGTVVRLATGQVVGADAGPSPVPEPASILLVLIGLALLGRAQQSRVHAPH
jgi:hypothetical protein